MGQRRVRGVALSLIVLASAACAPQPRLAASYEEYFVAACAAWDALFRAVGNPDTASGSDLSHSLDSAATAGDGAAAARVATDIARELKAGREQVAIAAGWQPRAPVMVQFDRVFVGYEAMIAAKVAAARREPNAIAPQAAFEQAGGLEGWFAMFEAARAAGGGAATDQQCANVPVTP
jgi:hypothetical protein